MVEILEKNLQSMPEDPKDQARFILSLLENLGMLPPLCPRGFDHDGLASKTPPSHRWEKE